MDVYQRRRLVALSALAAIFIVFVLLIRSCGGDDEEAPVTTAAGASGVAGATVLAQSDYASQADAICLESNTQLANVDETDAAQAASDRAEIVTGELQGLQSLPEPDDGQDQLDKLLAALEDLAAAYGDQALALERGDDTSASDIDATIDDSNAAAAKAADAFGMDVCGDPSQVGEADTGGDTTTSDTGDTTDTGGAPATTSEITPTPTTTTPVAPTEPAPTDDTGSAPAPAPPTDTGGDSGSGGVSP